MEAALKSLAPYLERMTDGETGDRRKWITPPIETFRANPDVEMTKDGNWTHFRDVVEFKVRDGVTLDPDKIRPGYLLAFQRSFESFKVLRERFGRPDLKFQVGIPAPLDLALFSFGEAAFSDPSLIEACTAATAREINAIAAIGGDDVVFQLETVAGLLTVAQAPSDQQSAAVERSAGTLLDLVSRMPAGTHVGFHLCLGDFNHESMGNMSDVTPVVLVANALAAGWPDSYFLDYIHGPFAAASDPPVADESFYEPLRDLQLPDDVRFIAGFLHEKLDHDAHRELLERIERLAGREVDIAASCGLGRRDTPEEAFEQMRETKDLIEDSSGAAA